MKKGFTIVELMVVVAVIGVLMTIVTTASMHAIRSARTQRRDAMRTAFQAAIATYQAADPEGKWPGAIQDAADTGKTTLLSEDGAQKVFQKIVQMSNGSLGTTLPLIDPHALFVAPSGAIDGKSAGMSYDEARHGDAHNRRKLQVPQMVFGYQLRDSGKFHRFNIIYHAETDSVEVSVESHDNIDLEDGTKNGSEE